VPVWLDDAEPVPDGLGVPVVEGDAEPVPDGLGMPVVEGDAEPVPDGLGVPVVEGDAEPVPDGLGVPVVEGDEVLVGDGSASAAAATSAATSRTFSAGPTAMVLQSKRHEEGGTLESTCRGRGHRSETRAAAMPRRALPRTDDKLRFAAGAAPGGRRGEERGGGATTIPVFTAPSSARAVRALLRAH
jgi:hypothetical protein